MMDPMVHELLSRPKSKLHDRLLSWGVPRIKASSKHMSQAYPRFQEIDQLYRAYREPDDSDEETRSESLTEGVQKIVVPYGFAQVQALLAFLISTFCDRKPIYPVEGMSGEGVGAIVHEHLIEMQMDQMTARGVLVMIQQLLDTLRYGMGFAKWLWTVREWPDFVRQMMPIYFGGEILGYEDELVEQDVVAYEGNDGLNVSPYDFFPDPRFSIGEFHRGEFCAHGMRRSWTELMLREEEGLYTGLDFVPDEHAGFAGGSDEGVGSSDTESWLGRALGVDTSGNEFLDVDARPLVRLHEMWAFVVPRQLGLPTRLSKDTPRLWVFTFANLKRVIRAEAANLPGRRFPFTGIEVHYDMHSPMNPGVIDIAKAMQYLQSWLVNSRMASVRKSLNSEIIVDPTLVEEDDYTKPNPSGVWRLAKDAWGGGMMDQAVKALPVVDTTASHWNDQKILGDIADQITGANRIIQGVGNSGRRAATEVNQTMQMAAGRMKLISLICAWQGFIPQGEMMLRNNQAFLSQRLQLKTLDAYRKIVGADFIEIGPELLAGLYRIPLLEQGIPTDKAFHASVLREVLGMGIQNPQVAQTLAQQINFSEIFAELMRQVGKRNLRDFFNPAPVAPPPPTQVQLMPDEQVQRQVAAGNLVPHDGFPLPAAGMTPGTGGEARVLQ